MTGSAEEPRVFRPGGVSYLRVPAVDPAQSATFYEAVFGWIVDTKRDDPSFEDGTDPEGDLRVATSRDPAGNEIGVWEAT